MWVGLSAGALRFGRHVNSDPCLQDEPNGDAIYTITYAFDNCEPEEPTTIDIEVLVKPCPEAADLLQQPMNLELVEERESMPANCEQSSENNRFLGIYCGAYCSMKPTPAHLLI